MNALLFLPLGVLLGKQGHHPVAALLLGAALAVGIEGLQLVVPGRHPTVGDIAWNGSGAALGVAIQPMLASLLRGTPPAWCGAVSALGVGLGLIVAGFALEPAHGPGAYWIQWTPTRPGVETFPGHLVRASLDGRELPYGRLPAESETHARLLGDWTVRLEVVGQPSMGQRAPLLVIGDDNQVEGLYVGVDGSDLVLRERLRANAWRLDRPEVRFSGFPEDAWISDTVGIALWRAGETRCAELAEVRRCDRGWSPARTWSLIYYPGSAGILLQYALDAVWAFSLLFVVGLVSRPGPPLGANVALAIGLATFGVMATPLAAPRLPEVVAAVLGASAGGLVSRRLRSLDPCSRTKRGPVRS